MRFPKNNNFIITTGRTVTMKVNILGTEYTIEKKAFKDEPIFEKKVLTDIVMAD